MSHGHGNLLEDGADLGFMHGVFEFNIVEEIHPRPMQFHHNVVIVVVFKVIH
jgi:hypothetical protein